MDSNNLVNHKEEKPSSISGPIVHTGGQREISVAEKLKNKINKLLNK